VASHTHAVQELRMAQAVLLPAFGANDLSAAAKVNWRGRATVARLQRRFRHRKEMRSADTSALGRRRRALMKAGGGQAFWPPGNPRRHRASWSS